MRGEQLLPARGPVRDHRGHDAGGELDGLLQGGGGAHTDIRLDRVHAVRAAQLVLRRLPAGQLPGVRARVPVQQQDAAGVQHGRGVRAQRLQPARGVRDGRVRADGRPVRAGPVLRVRVPHDPRHHGPVGAAARAQPARRVRAQRHTAGHHGHAGRVRRPVRQRVGLAVRLLPGRRHRAGVDGRLAAAGRRVAVRAPVPRPARAGVHTGGDRVLRRRR